MFRLDYGASFQDKHVEEQVDQARYTNHKYMLENIIK